MTVKTSISFVKLLRKSNLLTQQQHEQMLLEVDLEQDPRRLAKWLIRHDWMTRWQAQQLLSGHTKLFLGQYKLLDVAGQGGMGAVFKAEQTNFNRIVALKVMAKNMLSNKKAVSRFVREIQLAAALDHPNIVSAIDADCIGDRYFLVMEYVDGRELRSWIDEHGQLPIDWSTDCVRQAALGLQHAHERRLVHRDIKPANLLVSTDAQTGQPVVKILDFGLARFVSETKIDGGITRTGEIMGSPDYIAPEQALNAKDADIRADIFGLGCTFFEMLTGTLPYGGKSITEKIYSRLDRQAAKLSSRRPDIPPTLERIVSKMLECDPSRRYQTPGDLATALQSFRNDIAVESDSIIILELADESPENPIVISEAPADQMLVDFVEQLADRARQAPPVAVQRLRSYQRSSQRSLAIGMSIVIGFLIASVAVFEWNRDRKESDSISTEHKKETPQPERTKIEPAAPVVTNPIDEDDPNWRAAIWGTVSGHGVTLLRDGIESTVVTQQELPRSKFEVVELKMEGVQKLGREQFDLMQQLTALTRLKLNGSHIQDQQLQQIGRLMKLKSLHLGGNTLISDAGVKFLNKLTELTSLNLRFTSVGDQGLRSIGLLTQLQEINLEGTDVSNKGLKLLQELHNLKLIQLKYTNVTAAGAERLRAMLPGCVVEHN